MEKSRAIELLEHLAWDRDIERNPYGDALNMAIEALKAQLSECTTKGTPYLKEYATADPDTAIGGLREMGDNLLREIHSRAMSRMGDCISRQVAVDAVHKNYDTILDFKSDGRTVADSFEDIINALPPAQPERGYWIAPKYYPTQFTYTCSKCGYKQSFNGKFKFCPHCGADMRGEQGRRYLFHLR